MNRVAKLLCLCLFAATFLHAESKNPADYPLRVHIFSRDQTTWYHNRYAEEAKGEGRANLFENSEARGIDFNYDCSEKLKASFGYETYPAKWKKPGQELVVLLPVFGKTGSFSTCNLKTDVKAFAYARGSNGMNSESVAQFKNWMVKHDYDPEHGKNIPVRPEPTNVSMPPSAPGSALQAPAPPQ